MFEFIFNFKKNKKGASIPSGLTWVPATLLVFFIMFLFLAGALMAFKDGGSEFEAENSLEGKYDLYLQNQLISFLNSEVEFEEEKYLIKDLIYPAISNKWNSGTNSKQQLIKEISEEFTEKLLDEDELKGVKFFSRKNNLEGNPGEYLFLSSSGKPIGAISSTSVEKGVYCQKIFVSLKKIVGVCIKK